MALDFQCQNLTNTVWSVAMLKFCDDRISAKIQAAILSYVHLFTVKDLPMMAWSFAKHSFDDLHVIIGIILADPWQVRNFQPQNLSNTAWAVAMLSLRFQEPLLSSILSLGWPLVVSFDCQGLVNLAWAFSSLPRMDIHVMNAMSKLETA